MAKEHLVKARELIANGWTKGYLYEAKHGRDCYCLDGAVAEAHGIPIAETFDRVDSQPTYDKLYAHEGVISDLIFFNKVNDIANDGTDNPGSIVCDAYIFNDYQHRVEDVLAAFDKAIENYPVKETGV
jgi:hypothetical protein